MAEAGVAIDPPGGCHHLNQTVLDLAGKGPAIVATLRVPHERQVLRTTVNEHPDSVLATPRARL